SPIGSSSPGYQDNNTADRTSASYFSSRGKDCIQMSFDLDESARIQTYVSQVHYLNIRYFSVVFTIFTWVYNLFFSFSSAVATLISIIRHLGIITPNGIGDDKHDLSLSLEFYFFVCISQFRTCNTIY
ncbi:MAG: hypothetical protein EZS28_041654, partial [Streblomastix strix]